MMYKFLKVKNTALCKLKNKLFKLYSGMLY